MSVLRVHVAYLADALRSRRDVLRGSHRQRYSGGTLAVTAGALALVVAAFRGYRTGFETINGACAWMPDHLLQMLTYCGDSLFAVLLLLPAARRFPQIVWLGVVSALTATLISHALKPLVDAARPAAVLAFDTFRVIGPAYKAHSFPSGHTVTAFVVAGVYACFLPSRGLRALLLGAACCVGLSRVAVGVHWPVDVLAGAAIGLGSVTFAGWFTSRWRAGLDFLPFHLLVASLAATAATALFLRAPYPGATPLLHATACVGLAIVLRDFVLLPAFDTARRAGVRARRLVAGNAVAPADFRER